MRRNTVKFDLLIVEASKLLLILACMLLSACSCNKLFFYPQTQLLITPDQGGIEYETVKIVTEDNVTLHNWLIKPASQPKGRILFLHGNAENISTHIRSVYWLPQSGYEVLLMDYRGFGKSEGTPCLPDVFLDIEAGFEWLTKHNGKQLPIFLLGQSLGATLAAYSVGSHPEWELAGVILDAPFASYRDIARDKLASIWLTWPLQYPLSWMFSDKYSPIYVAHLISPRPLLVLYSTEDIIVPASHSKNLFDHAKNPKKSIITNERHTGSFLKEEYRNQVIEFLDNT